MQAPKERSSHREKSCQGSTCHLPAMCTHLTWNKVDNTTPARSILRQKSHREPHFSTHWWDRLTPQHAGGEVWVWQHTTIISSCHYLPSRSQLCLQRRVHKHCTQAKMHKLPRKTTVGAAHQNLAGLSSSWCHILSLVVTHCQFAGRLLSIVLTEVSILATTNSGNVSLSIWLERHKDVYNAEGSPLGFL